MMTRKNSDKLPVERRPLNSREFSYDFRSLNNYAFGRNALPYRLTDKAAKGQSGKRWSRRIGTSCVLVTRLAP